MRTELTRTGTWWAMRAVCECGCGHTLIAAVGATEEAARLNFEHAEKVAKAVREAFGGEHERT